MRMKSQRIMPTILRSEPLRRTCYLRYCLKGKLTRACTIERWQLWASCAMKWLLDSLRACW